MNPTEKQDQRHKTIDLRLLSLIYGLWSIVLSLSLVAGCKEKGTKGGLDFTLKALDGAEWTLSKQRGKVVIIDFWATWCRPCLQSIPVFNAVYDKYKEEDVSVIGVVLDGEQALRRFLQQHKISYPVLIGTEDVARRYGIQAIPTTYIIDKSGSVASKHVGLSADFQETLEKEIEKLLKED